ncbi:MAG: hypothetical protein MI802_21015 [Desulfobacterales bacterium]|nr:hypothetical protein [Desulfobacterales bacterium]
MTAPNRQKISTVFLLVFAIIAWSAAVSLSAEISSPETEWDGHLKLYSRALFPRAGSAYEAAGLSPNYDGFAEFRVNNRTFFGDALYTEVHYETLFGGGGTRRDGEELKSRYPALFPDGLFGPPDDDRRFFDLTGTLNDDKDTMGYHRLDRAMVAFTPAWGEVRLGRQAVTWGHGFTFNPMDLFNPFSPTDLERDYKTGDDLILVQFPVNTLNVELDLELIYVARREADTGNTSLDENSIGAKVHFFVGETEADIMLTRHYEDIVAGAGAVGYLGGAAWRWDVTATFLHEDSRGRSAYLSGIINMDYSWIWLDKNWYGYLELYYNGLSDADYTDHFSDPALSDRLARGELFALGRWYLSGNLNLEVHPLLNAYLTPIVNLNDGSGALLPRAVYDWADNIRLTLSGSLSWGGSSTEYGGYPIPGTDFSSIPADSISGWINWYF